MTLKKIFFPSRRRLRNENPYVTGYSSQDEERLLTPPSSDDDQSANATAEESSGDVSTTATKANTTYRNRPAIDDLFITNRTPVGLLTSIH